jgi:hypothetical protein
VDKKVVHMTMVVRAQPSWRSMLEQAGGCATPLAAQPRRHSPEYSRGPSDSHYYSRWHPCTYTLSRLHIWDITYVFMEGSEIGSNGCITNSGKAPRLIRRSAVGKLLSSGQEASRMKAAHMHQTAWAPSWSHGPSMPSAMHLI